MREQLLGVLGIDASVHARAQRLITGGRSTIFNHLHAPSTEGVRFGGSDIDMPLPEERSQAI